MELNGVNNLVPWLYSLIWPSLQTNQTRTTNLNLLSLIFSGDIVNCDSLGMLFE